MISKFLSKLKSILFKSSASSETPLKKAKKTTKPKKASKPTKAKSKKGDAKKVIETLTTCLELGLKVQKLFMKLDLRQPNQ